MADCPPARNRDGHVAYRAAGDLVALDADDSLAIRGLDRDLDRDGGLPAARIDHGIADGLRLARPERKHLGHDDERPVTGAPGAAASPMISIAMPAVWSLSVAVILVMPGATGIIFQPPSTFSILAIAGFGSVTLTFGSLLTSSNPPFSYWRSSLAVCGMAWTPADRTAARRPGPTTLPAGLITDSSAADDDLAAKTIEDPSVLNDVDATADLRHTGHAGVTFRIGLGLLSAVIGDDLGLSGTGA